MAVGYARGMPWVRARLHGQHVYARAKADGGLLVKGERVDVCYRPDATRLYTARASNLVIDEGAAVLADDACGSRAEPAAPANRPSSTRPTKRAVSTTSMRTAPKDAIVAYADGACSGNPGPAGLGVVVIDGSIRTEISESLGEGTNNIAELIAIERVLDTVHDTARPLVIYTDSAYAIGVLVKGWKAKANVALVDRLRKRLAKHPATRMVHVRGHAGVVLNERADELAREAVRTGTTRCEKVS
jgi:ribonuclease HI